MRRIEQMIQISHRRFNETEYPTPPRILEMNVNRPLPFPRAIPYLNSISKLNLVDLLLYKPVPWAGWH
jgi:hypothetical protein